MQKPTKKEIKQVENKKNKDNKTKSEKSGTIEKQEKDKKGEEPKKQSTAGIKDDLANQEALKMQEDQKDSLKNWMIVPNMFIDIPAKGKGYFDIVFKPLKKIDVEEKIFFEIQDYIEPLCVVRGDSLISQFSLDTDLVQFIGVMVGFTGYQIVTLRNTGDITGSFFWKIDDRRNMFSIDHMQGFVLPHANLPIKISCTPKTEKCEYKIKAKCIIKEFKEPLELLIKGNSIHYPEAIDTLKFECQVRNKQVLPHAISKTNDSSATWLVKTELTHEAFTVPGDIVMSCFSCALVRITYAPKTMTLNGPHEGKIILKFPDGTGEVHNLIGIANPPSVKKRIEKEIRSKQSFSTILSLTNWLNIKQTFNVITEVTSPVTSKTLYSVFGHDTIELNALESKDYKWGVYVITEGQMDFTVKFKNCENGEYEFFEISLKVLPGETAERFSFNTRVRESVTKQICLENPTNVHIVYCLETTERCLYFPKIVEIKPHTSVKIDLTYTPIQTEKITTTLTAKCEELGTYSYLIKMHAEPPKEEQLIIFVAQLGSKATKSIKFRNIYDKPVDFMPKFGIPEFAMERNAPIQPGDEGNLVITFEPSGLRQFNSRLSLYSPVAGEYVYPLEGKCVPPVPKGPYIIRQNNPIAIEFKNPYFEEKLFTYMLNPDAFYCDFNAETLDPRRTVRFLIYNKSSQSEPISYPVTGKLVIYSPDEPEIHWTYYLQVNP